VLLFEIGCCSLDKLARITSLLQCAVGGTVEQGHIDWGSTWVDARY